MIYLTGDIHGDARRLAPENLLFRYGIYTCPKDIFIIVGDFGIPWVSPDADWDKKMLALIASFPFTVAFLDGNHENFVQLANYPEVPWHGGTARQLLPNLFYLQRGELYTLERHSFFTFGGAMSPDNWTRREGVTWWPEEVPSEEEFRRGEENLDRAGWKVDYVLTHTPPAKWKIKGGAADPHTQDPCPVARRLDTWETKLTYKKWFFGHMHRDRYDYRKKEVWLYKDIVDYKVTSDFATLALRRLEEETWTYPAVLAKHAQPPRIFFPDFPECTADLAPEQYPIAPDIAQSRLKYLLRGKIASHIPLPGPTPVAKVRQQYPAAEIFPVTLTWDGLKTKEERK